MRIVELDKIVLQEILIGFPQKIQHKTGDIVLHMWKPNV